MTGPDTRYTDCVEDTLMSATTRNISDRIVGASLLGSELEDYPRKIVDSLVEGLQRRKKFIPCEFLYDDEGSRYVDDFAEYYLPRKERELLHRCGPEIVAATGPCEIFELGSGSAKKTTILLRAFFVTYNPTELRCETHLRSLIEHQVSLRRRYALALLKRALPWSGAQA
jgi:histidine-specific SAM-dependent methyltransferase